MANDNQLAVQKRLICAEDLFEPVDATVLVVSVGGRSGGKTMAMYESLFRKRVEMAPTIDAAPVVHGRWVSVPNKDARICSVCNQDEPYKFADKETDVYDFCPHCGAKMDLKEDDHD